jgi:dienelactone hydrolase
MIETFSYATHTGPTEARLYRPSTAGRHPAVVVSLGVVPLGMEHPQSARFAEALARSGFAALLHWSPALRDLRLDPGDVGDLVSAYTTLMRHPHVDPTRSGLMGTCVGGSFALMAAADPAIRERLAFLAAYAPFTSMWTLGLDIASATRLIDGTTESWLVDPLAWRMFVRSVTERLDPSDLELLRAAFEDRFTWDATNTWVIESRTAAVDAEALSADARAVYRLLTAEDRESAGEAMRALPPSVQRLLTSMSPLSYVKDIEAPLISLLHDRRDHLIPVTESRQLWRVLSARAGARYVELGFQHLDPTRLSPFRLLAELPKLYRGIYPLFLATTR